MSANLTAAVHTADLVIPTYHVREDPNPPLFADTDPWVYPYPKQDEILRPRDEAQVYRAVVLENPYLKVTVLPELGGRVYSAFDKLTQREIFHKVDVIKPALIGLRGAWICGGIEFNFIKGHHVLTVSPVDHLIREHPDGSVSVIVGQMERRSRARWNVTLTLHPDRAYLQTDLKLYNRYRYRLDFYQWSNSSVEAREALYYPYPIEYAISSGRHLYRWPIQGGLDISRWKNMPVAHDFFAIGTDKDFMGVYYEDTDVGMVHYANHHEAPGKKLFTWGTDDAGRIWDELLGDGHTPYIEPQAGCVVDQSTFLFLQPHQTVTWRDYWWSVRGMKGFVEVNQDAALNLAASGEHKTLLAVNVTRALPGARLRLLIGGQITYEATLDLSPNAPYQIELALPPADWREREAQLVLDDAEGQTVIRHHRPAPNYTASVELPRPFAPQVDARSSAEELAIAANEAEKLRAYERAEALYRQALALDSGYARAHAALGALYSQQGLYQAAYEALKLALHRDPDLGLAQYHMGIVCRELGDWKAARMHFWATRLDPGYNAQSFYYLAEMALAESDLASAEALLRRSLDLNRLHIKAHDILALTLRAMGRTNEARAILQGVLDELEPTDILAQAERWWLDPSEEQAATLQARIGGEPQVWLELASDYAAVQRWEEAIQVLRLNPANAQENTLYAMPAYTLAYYHDKLGDQEAARRLYAIAARADTAALFPYRLEELDILRRAIEVNPHDGQAHALLGTLLYALRRKDEALDVWRQALALRPDAVTYRNLGKALWKFKGDLTGAKTAYEQALVLRQDDYRLYADLYDILNESGASAEERLALLRQAPTHGRIQARQAEALVALERWDEAIQVLETMQFDPYEGESDTTRPAYYRAYLGRGLARQARGEWPGALADFEQALRYPRNVGVGKSTYAQDAEACYWAGVAAQALGDAAKARRYWEEGASILPRPYQEPASPRAGYTPEARYYKSLCLQKLGRAEEAARLF